MTARGYKFYLLVLVGSLTRLLRSLLSCSTRRYNSYPQAAMEYPLYLYMVLGTRDNPPYRGSFIER